MMTIKNGSMAPARFFNSASTPVIIRSTMRHFLEVHRLTGLVVTCGEEGAIAIDAAGEQASVAPALALQVVDTVGAGDAFASVMLLGIQLQWPLQLILERAQSFASALVGRRGATVWDADFYSGFVGDWAL